MSFTRNTIYTLLLVCWVVCAVPTPSEQRVSSISVLPLLEKAREQFELSDYEFAIKYYQEAIKNDSSNPRVHFGLGSAYLATEQYTLAVEHLRQAVDLNPALIEGYYALSSAYFALGEQERAVRAYRNALGLDLREKDISTFHRVTISSGTRTHVESE